MIAQTPRHTRKPEEPEEPEARARTRVFIDIFLIYDYFPHARIYPRVTRVTRVFSNNKGFKVVVP